MANKRLLIVLSVISVLLLAGLVFGNRLIISTNNKDFANDPLFYKSLGNEMLKRGESQKAIAAYEKALTLGDDLDTHNNLAILYYAKGDYKNAIIHLRALILSDQENPSYHYDLAVNLVDKFRNTEDKSIADLNEALDEYETADGLSSGFENSKQNIAVLKKVLGI